MLAYDNTDLCAFVQFNPELKNVCMLETYQGELALQTYNFPR